MYIVNSSHATLHVISSPVLSTLQNTQPYSRERLDH